MNFKELCDEWLNENHKYNIKDRTYLRYETSLRNYIVPYLGDLDINNITPRDLQFRLNKIRDIKSRKTKENIKSSTYNTVIVIIKMIFSYALDFGLINYNPTIKLKRLPKESIPSTALTRLEQIKLQNYIDRNRNIEYFPIYLCLYSGLRIGELLALEWSDINLKTGVMSISKQYYRTKENNKWILKTSIPKSKTSIRDIPLPFFIVEILRLLKKNRTSKYICVRKDGKRMDDRFLRLKFEQLLKLNRIKHYNFHTLRHTFATRALENKMDIKTLSELLGHSSAAITLNIYAHSMLDTKKAAMRKMKKIQ